MSDTTGRDVPALLGTAVSETDHIALARLVVELGWRVDNGVAETVYHLCTEDAELIITGPPVVGREAIRKWGRDLDVNPPIPQVRHVITNTRFLTEGPDRAYGTSMLTAYSGASPEGTRTTPITIGQDHDAFVRTAEGWKLAFRRWETLM